MKLIRLITLIIIISNTAFGQKKSNGKVRAILVNPKEALSYIETNNFDSCFIYFYNGDQIIKIINISKLLTENKTLEEKLFQDIYLENGVYTAFIENLYTFPILVTNINVRKGKMSFIPVDFNNIIKIKNIRPEIIIWDYQKLLEEYMLKKQ